MDGDEIVIILLYLMPIFIGLGGFALYIAIDGYIPKYLENRKRRKHSKEVRKDIEELVRESKQHNDEEQEED